VSARDTRETVQAAITRYNGAWNAHDLDAIIALHAPGMVFENHTAGERAEGDDVRSHIAGIFENWPDLAFTTRRLYASEGLAVCEWTATATRQDTGERVEWDGVDVFPFEGGLILRKDVYSASHRARVVSD
jgi:ketosteroid isomerase-like protein